MKGQDLEVPLLEANLELKQGPVLVLWVRWVAAFLAQSLEVSRVRVPWIILRIAHKPQGTPTAMHVQKLECAAKNNTGGA